MSKFATKSPLFGYFGRELEKSIVIIEISTLKLALLQNFAKKQKFLNLGQKMPY